MVRSGVVVLLVVSSVRTVRLREWARVAFLALRILYVIALVCFVFVPCSPPESLPGKDVLCRLLPRPLPSVCFLFFSFLFRPCSPPICFGETSSIL